MDAVKPNSGPPSATPSGHAAASSVPIAPPRIPDHELLRQIGGGSYGQVWLARSVMGTYRAVKVVYRAGFEHDRPFRREFEGIQKFEPLSRSHEGLIDILQIGHNEAAGYFYYVMELADAAGENEQVKKREGEEIPLAHLPIFSPATYVPRTLKLDIHHRRRLTCRECLQLGLSLTSALDHLHQRGLIHRDIKPSNIIFVNGIPKLADIGLVAEAGKTLSCVGTEGFIPPEGSGTLQADLFSLGKVLYEVSTGKDRQDYPEPPTDLGQWPEQDEFLELQQVIFKACAPDARKRYQSARQMHGDLALVQSGKSVKRLHAIERRLGLVTRVGVAVAALALLGGGAYYQATQAEKKASARLERLQVDNAVRLMDEGNLPGALLWVAESLRLAKGNSSAEEIHRFRFESVWRQCPKLSSLCLHQKRIYDAAFSPDGRRFVTASADHTARIWDAETGQPVTPPLAHDGEVVHAVFSPDGGCVATVSRDGVLRVWDAATGHALCPPAQHRLEIRSVAFSPDGRRIVTSSGAVYFTPREVVQRVLSDGKKVIVPRATDGTVGEAQVWDTATGEPLGQPLLHSNRVHEAHFSPDGRKIVTASEDQTGVIWDVNTSQPVAPPLRHAGVVRNALFSPDGWRVLTASEDHSAQVWDADTGQPVGLPLRHGKGVLYAAFSPDGSRIVTTSRDQTACLWDAATGQLLCLPLRHESDVWDAQFSPDGRRLVTAGSEPIIRVWDAVTGELLARLSHNNSGTFATFSPDGGRLLTISRDRLARVWNLSFLSPATATLQHDQWVLNAEFNRDGSRVLTVSADRSARVWDAVSGQPVTPWLKDPESFKPHFTVTARFSPDGHQVVTAGYSMARMYDAVTGQPVCSFLNQTNVRNVAFSPDGSRLFVVSSDGTGRLWGTRTGQSTALSSKHENLVWDSAFTPDGRWLVTSSGDPDDVQKGVARVWDALTGRPAGPPIKLRGIASHVCFSPDGHCVLTACTQPAMDEREAQLWNWRTGKPVGPPMRHTDGVPYAEFSPDGRRVLTASFDKTARVWDAKTGQPLTPALKHARQVQHAAFSADGRRIVTASEDATARIWDAATGEPLGPPLKHNGMVWRARFSPDGRRVVTASQDHTARMWDTPKTERPVQDLSLLAELLSGQRIDETGGVVALDPEALRVLWQTLRSKYPADFAAGTTTANARQQPVSNSPPH